MDISVSRLNNRMVLQVPPELPLGLVFVVGQVKNLVMTPEAGRETSFELVEADHYLHCRLSRQVAEEVLLKEGDMVRVSGQLSFDTHLARYYLLARDLEVVPDISASRTKMAPILADIKKRADAAALVRPELPRWVKRLAPPEIQAELGLTELQEPAASTEEPTRPEELEPGTDLLAPVGRMSDDMLAFLSEAMDQSEEVELTPEVLAQFFPLEPQESQSRQPARRWTVSQTTAPPAEQNTVDPEPAAESASAPDAIPTPPMAPPLVTPRPPTESNLPSTFQRLLFAMMTILLVILLVVLVLLIANYF